MHFAIHPARSVRISTMVEGNAGLGRLGPPNTKRVPTAHQSGGIGSRSAATAPCVPNRTASEPVCIEGLLLPVNYSWPISPSFPRRRRLPCQMCCVEDTDSAQRPTPLRLKRYTL